MQASPKRPRGDHQLVQIVDAALGDAAVRSGDWLACRPGCTQCCIGVFEINQLDVARLREGMEALGAADPKRAGRVRQRATASLERIGSTFPGDRQTGRLGKGAEFEQAFDEFGNDEPCPALDIESGMCDLYAHRPMTCRVFGPPVRTEGGLGVCELCFQGATPEQIAECEMRPDEQDLESKLLREMKSKTGMDGQTIVAFVLAR